MVAPTIRLCEAKAKMAQSLSAGAAPRSKILSLQGKARSRGCGRGKALHPSVRRGDHWSPVWCGEMRGLRATNGRPYGWFVRSRGRDGTIHIQGVRVEFSKKTPPFLWRRTHTQGRLTEGMKTSLLWPPLLPSFASQNPPPSRREAWAKPWQR